VLALIGVKLVVHAMHHKYLPFVNHSHNITAIPDISIVTSLVPIVVLLVIAAAFSLLKTRNDEPVGSAGYSGD
jgi:tellurite resistance protein TerC